MHALINKYSKKKWIKIFSNESKVVKLTQKSSPNKNF